MAPVQIPGLNIPLITGPLVLGFMWAYMLFGIFICQTYLYFMHFPKDRTWIKRLVSAITILESLFMVFMTIAAWNSFGDGWGDIDSLLNIYWAWVPMVPLNTIPAWMVQSFFVWRIWQLSKNVYICVLIELISLAQVGSAMYFCIKTTLGGLTNAYLFTQTPAISTWLSCSASCDILITLSIITILYRKNVYATSDRTTHIVTRLIRFTVETGFITSIAAVFELVSWLTAHQLSIHYIGYLAFGKLYSNTLLATLNSRALIFGQDQTHVEISLGSSNAVPRFSASTNTHSVELDSIPVRRGKESIPIHYPKR